MANHLQIIGEEKVILQSESKHKGPFFPKDVLIKIARLLMIQSDYLCTAGLMKGKMGLVIYFYKLGRILNHQNYINFADFLLQDICESLKYYSSISFYSGLTGIGCALEYLFRNNYIAKYPEDVMRNIDELVLERDVNRIKSTDLDKGIKGIGYYVIYRIANRDKRTIDDEYIANLINILTNADDNECKELSALLLNIFNNKTITNNNPDVFRKIILQVEYDDEKIFDKGRLPGIWKNGYTGIGLKIIENEVNI